MQFPVTDVFMPVALLLRLTRCVCMCMCVCMWFVTISHAFSRFLSSLFHSYSCARTPAPILDADRANAVFSSIPFFVVVRAHVCELKCIVWWMLSTFVPARIMSFRHNACLWWNAGQYIWVCAFCCFFFLLRSYIALCTVLLCAAHVCACVCVENAMKFTLGRL